jgi:hypothetical protein
MIQALNFDDFNINNYGEGGRENLFGGFGGGGGSAVLTANLLDGGGGGGSSIEPTPIVIEPTPIIATSTNKTFQITSNVAGAQIYVNGINSFKTTPQSITFTKEELLSGDKEITIVKEGYSTGEKYVVSVENPRGATIITRPRLFNSQIQSTLGLSNTFINVAYFLNNVEQLSNELSTTETATQNLSFNLTQTPVINETTLYNFTINVSGAGNSVRVIKNGNVEFFPDNGSTPYSDLGGTTFRVESADTSLYRITQIQTSTRPPIIANANESLSYNITLGSDISITLTTELVRQPTPATNPSITLLRTEAITYNINSKLGVPIGFLKNADVKAVTVIVGTDILEFDDLQEGDVAGITIPHSVFKNIGKYGAKIYPFSLSDYENEVRPAETPIKITTNPYSGGGGPSREVLTEVVVPVKPKVVTNPYVGGGTPSIGTPKPVVVQPTPRPSGGGGGSYGGGSPYGGGGGPSRNREQNFR